MDGQPRGNSMRKLCSHPGCANPPTYRGYCQFHSRVKERNINRAGKRIYSTKRWKVLRSRVLFEEPLCRVCGAIATDVDHVLAIENGGEHFSRDNCQPLCAHHHGQKTRREQMTRR